MGTKTHRDPEILDVLERIFAVLRDKTIAPFPYDKKTNAIALPFEVETELRRLVSNGDRIEAIKYVTRLTGAGLRVSKAYVDRLGRRH